MLWRRYGHDSHPFASFAEVTAFFLCLFAYSLKLFITLLLDAAAMLATFVHPNHIVCLCSWGLTHLPLTCNSKWLGYSTPSYFFSPLSYCLTINSQEGLRAISQLRLVLFSFLVSSYLVMHRL
ncbi:hypothetical protein DB317_17050 [Vibrio cholerae]|nr:hypothetical protein DB317_17050 [Vibrio cholerae]